MAKIAVYAICRDEAKHATRFMASMGEADGVFVLDTGSQDESPRILRDLGATVEAETILPWRFDTARNRALAMVTPDFDICICCDLDEVFAPGWRQALEDAWTPGTTRMAYPFYYDARGSFFYRSLIHTRRGYVWHWPIHEALLALGPEQVGRCDGLRLFHLPDPEKSRAAYLPLLEQAVQAAPTTSVCSSIWGASMSAAGGMPQPSPSCGGTSGWSNGTPRRLLPSVCYPSVMKGWATIGRPKMR